MWNTNKKRERYRKRIRARGYKSVVTEPHQVNHVTTSLLTHVTTVSSSETSPKHWLNDWMLMQINALNSRYTSACMLGTWGSGAGRESLLWICSYCCYCLPQLYPRENPLTGWLIPAFRNFSIFPPSSQFPLKFTIQANFHWCLNWNGSAWQARKFKPPLI